MSLASSRRGFLQTLGLGAAGLAAGLRPARAAAASRPPNIVLLFADDLGWTDLACFGSQYYETPNLDRLASQGVRFTNAYSCAGNCSPSRACLLSGQYVPRHGVYTVGPRQRFPGWPHREMIAPENASGLDPAKITMPEALKAAGYTTGMFGKWHVTHEVDGKDGQRPTDHGFDEAVTFKGPHYGFTPWPETAPAAAKEKYLSDYLADQALAFIEKNKDRPFFLYLPDFLVHVPQQTKAELLEKYKKKPGVGGHNAPKYAAMVEALDFSFGRVLAKLDDLGLTDNTLVVFLSDNGGVNAEGQTSNAPLRGSKGQLLEGGIREPMIARWPGVIAPGSTCETPVISVDLYPTFVEAVGGQPPAPDTHPLDGRSLVALMRAGDDQSLATRDLFWWMPGYLPQRQTPANAMRSGDWKLTETFETGKLELYNLRADIGESQDLAATEPARVAEMHARMKQWRQDIGAVIPERNPKVDLKKAAELDRGAGAARKGNREADE